MTQLSQASARAILPGEELRCHVIKGLSLRCKPSGAKWFLEYRSPVDGSRRRPKLGDFPALTVEAARSAARSLLQRVAAGEDPSGAKQAAKVAPTMAELHAWYMDNHARPNKKAKSADLDDWQWRKYLAADLGPLRAADVTGPDLNRVLAKIAKASGDTTANRCRSLLSKMLNLAEGEALGWRAPRSNPITGENVPKRAEFPRRRFLSRDEIGRLSAHLQAEAIDRPRHVTALVCILYSGSRVTEMATAKWAHVEGKSIVRRDHKADRTGRYRTIRLPDQAWLLIRALPQHSGGWIFGEDVTADSLQDAWQRIRKAAGLPDVQIRDFRRTFASTIRSSGGTISDAGGLLGHSDPTITARHYAFLFEDEAHERVQSVADSTERLLLAQGLPLAGGSESGGA